MKKGFTLVEIVITLVLIGIVLSMVSNIGQSFSARVRFANTKEITASAVQNVVQEAATTNSVYVDTGRRKYGYINLMIAGTGKIQRTYGSGELTEPVVRFADINNGLIESSGYSFTVLPYAIGCEIGSGNTFRLLSAENTALKACYQTDAATCKMREVQCAQ